MRIPNVKTAIKAAGKVVSAVAAGQAVLVSEEIVTERLNACESCEFFDASARQCKRCTCFIDVKVNLSTETCPEEKWKR